MTIWPRRRQQAGITTLEVVLAVSAGTLLILGFLAFVGRQVQTFTAILNQGRSPQAGAVLVDALRGELHNVAIKYGATTGGTVSTFNGTQNAYGLNFDPAGNLYVVDDSVHVHKATPPGYATFPVWAIGFTTAEGVVWNPSTSLAYVTDRGGNKLWSTDGVTTTIVSAALAAPSGLAVNAGGNLIVGSDSNGSLSQVTPAGVVTPLLGILGTTSINGVQVLPNGTMLIARNGGPNEIELVPAGGGSYTVYQGGMVNPHGLAVDPYNGYVYVSESSKNNIQMIATPSVALSVLAGDPVGTTGNVDGPGTTARFNYPVGLAMDSQGNLLVGDMTNNAIRKVTLTRASAGLAFTAASSQSFTFTSTGGSTESLAYDPVGRQLVVNRGAGTQSLVPDAAGTVVNGGSPLGPLLTAAGVATTGAVPVFTYLDGASPPNDLDTAAGQVPAGSLANIARVQVYLVLQQGPRSAPIYLRSSFKPR